MSAPLPQEYYKHLQQLRKPAQRRRPDVPWMPILLLLAVVVGGGWAYYRYVWEFRLPQVRTLKDRKGDVIAARLEARDQDFLKYTLLSDLSVRYIAINELTPEDQDFVRNTNAALGWTFPLEYQLVLDGKEVPVRIEARDDNWVKYTLISDGSIHFIQISTLPLANQDLIRHLAATLSMNYPMDYQLTDAQGRKTSVSLLGHNDDLVNYITLDDNIKHYELISALSAADQALVRQMPSSLSLDYPVEHVLTTVQGKTLPGRLEGRSDNVVKMVNKADDTIHYFAINDLAVPDQRFVLAFPENLSMAYPFTADMVDKDGKPLHVVISGRAADIVRLSLPGVTDDFYPLTMFSKGDQEVILSLPANLRMQYPLEYVLTGPDNQPLNRQVLGRNSTYVKINTPDGKIYAYPIGKLSALNQSVLKLLPANIENMEVEPSKLAGYYDIQVDHTPAINDLEKRMALSIQGDEDFQHRLSASTESFPTVSGGPVDPRQGQLDNTRLNLETNYKTLLNIMSKEVLAAEPANVRKWRATINGLMAEIDYLELHLQDADLATADRVSTRQTASDDLAQMESLIKNVLNSEGMDIP